MALKLTRSASEIVNVETATAPGEEAAMYLVVDRDPVPMNSFVAELRERLDSDLLGTTVGNTIRQQLACMELVDGPGDRKHLHPRAQLRQDDLARCDAVEFQGHEFHPADFVQLVRYALTSEAIHDENTDSRVQLVRDIKADKE